MGMGFFVLCHAQNFEGASRTVAGDLFATHLGERAVLEIPAVVRAEEDATCASTSYRCQGDNQILDPTKNDAPCDAAACTDLECCKAITCASTSYGCQCDNQILDPTKNDEVCDAAACTDLECCKDATCAGTTHVCTTVNFVRNPLLDDEVCVAAACADDKCCKAQQWTCANPVRACGEGACTDEKCCKAIPTCASTTVACDVNFVPDPDQDGTECGEVACDNEKCCKAHQWTCAVPDHGDCEAGKVRDDTQNGTECGAAACTDTQCCKDKKDSGAFPSAPLAGMLVALCLHVGSAFA